jgi:hypothetical protein
VTGNLFTGLEAAQLQYQKIYVSTYKPTATAKHNSTFKNAVGPVGRCVTSMLFGVK